MNLRGRPQAAPLLALTMGEPAGIGAELALKAWRHAQGPGAGRGPRFFVLGDPDHLAATGRSLRQPTPVEAISGIDAVDSVFPHALPVLPIPLPAPARAGRLDPANAPAVIQSIERAVGLALRAEVDAIITGPIHKATLYDAGFAHPGHTEFLGALAGLTEPPVMMLACPGLRVVPVTVHLALAEAVRSLSRDAIVHAGRVTAQALARDFAVAHPRLAIAALNPHAGESGALGREEIEIIAPAVEALRAEGHSVHGPAPADALFHAQARPQYDAALCMYHDQALIPLKTLDFARGVNITLGLPFVRTSPDHGTGLSIAGQDAADPTSLIAALETAAALAANRSSTAAGAPLAV